MDTETGAVRSGRSPILDQYREYYDGVESFEHKPRCDCRGEYRWEVAPSFGQGFTELFQLRSGPSIGLCGYQLRDVLRSSYRERGKSLKFSLLYAGHFSISTPRGDRAEVVRGGDIWFSPGEECEVECVQPGEEYINGIAVEISDGMLDAWLGEYPCAASHSLEKHLIRAERGESFFPLGAIPKARALSSSHPAMQAAWRLFMTPRSTICDMLHFESLALDFLHTMLTLDEAASIRPCECLTQRQRAVEEARSILDAEWGAPPTITCLARRVGVNECYLKRDFRSHTGLSIGAYVRRLRMEKALELIESGQCSVLQAAMLVGYSNPSHFSRAFKRFHGRLPSAFLGRS